MAQVHAVGQPVNDSERKAIMFFADRLDDHHHIYHNLEFSTENNNPYEYDMIIVHDKAIYCVEVKGWQGRVVGNANEWRIDNYVRKSPILTNNNKKRVLQSYLADFDTNLTETTTPVDSLIVLTEDSVEVQLHGSQSYRVLSLEDALKYMKQRQGSSISPYYKKLNQFFENHFRPLSHKGRIREFEIMDEVSRDDSLGYIAYLCKHSIIDSKTYLLKVYNFEYLDDETQRDKRKQIVERDAKALHSIQLHLNIVDPEPPFYNTDGRFVLPLEWVDGLSLRSLLDGDERLDFSQRLTIAKQVCDSLRHVHQFDVVHRNLTPKAIIIPKDEPLKLVNFDLAKVSSIGTLIQDDLSLHIDDRYAAPEILLGGVGRASPKSDIYSLGVILFELFTGQHPYEKIQDVRAAGGLPVKLSDIDDSLPYGLDLLISGMCKFHVAERHHDLGKVLSYLKSIKHTSTRIGSLVGETLSDKYRINKRLADGGESVVYEGTELYMNNRLVAIKVWNDKRILDNAHQQEMEKLVKLSNNPHVADVYTFDTDERLGVSYMVIEHAANGTLDDLLEDHGAVPVVEAQRIFHQICVALEAMHTKQMVHLDIKPSNILFDDDNKVQVADFGISRLVEQQVEEWESPSGTPGYVDPEIIMGDSLGTVASDIYSLGIVLHQMLTGKSPDEHSVFEQGVDQTLPPPLIAVIEKATHLEPENRYVSVADFESALNQAVELVTQTFHQVTMTDDPVKLPESKSFFNKIRALFK